MSKEQLMCSKCSQLIIYLPDLTWDSSAYLAIDTVNGELGGLVEVQDVRCGKCYKEERGMI